MPRQRLGNKADEISDLYVELFDYAEQASTGAKAVLSKGVHHRRVVVELPDSLPVSSYEVSLFMVQFGPFVEQLLARGDDVD